MAKDGGSAGKWAAITALATVAMAVPAVWGMLQPAAGPSSQTSPDQVAMSARPVTPSTSVVSDPTPAPSAPTPVTIGACIDRTGSSAPCGQNGSGLVVGSRPCDSAIALASMAIDPARQLAVSVDLVGDACTLFPGSTAVSAGATAMDIKAVAGGGTAPRLAVCYSGDSGPEVVCSQPHLIEAVSGWLTSDEDVGARKTRCEALARDYTDRTFDAPNEPLTVAVLMSGGHDAPYRCGVKSPRALTESVWKIGGRHLAAATTP